MKKARSARRTIKRNLRLEGLELRQLMAAAVLDSPVVAEQASRLGPQVEIVEATPAPAKAEKLAATDVNPLQVSPEAMQRLEQLLMKAFPELADRIDRDPSAGFWTQGIEKPQTGTEYVDFVQAVLQFSNRDTEIPVESEAFARWLLAGEEQGPGVDYGGMNKSEGDDGDTRSDRGEAGDVGDAADAADVSEDESGKSGTAWDTFVNWLSGAAGGAVSETPTTTTGKAAGGVASWIMTILGANTAGNNFEGAVDNKSSEVYGWATINDLRTGSYGERLDDATKIDSGDHSHYEDQGPLEMPVEPELNDADKALLELFPPISGATRELHEHIDKQSRYWSDKTPNPLADAVDTGEIRRTTGIEVVDKPPTDFGRDRPAFQKPDDGVTDPPRHQRFRGAKRGGSRR